MSRGIRFISLLLKNRLKRGGDSVPYHIDYTNAVGKGRSVSGVRRFLLTACLFLLFSILVSDYWPEGMDMLKKTLLPNETLQAVEAFAQELNCGFSFADAARNFMKSVGVNGYPD